jgi:hypothetical protein
VAFDHPELHSSRTTPGCLTTSLILCISYDVKPWLRSKIFPLCRSSDSHWVDNGSILTVPPCSTHAPSSDLVSLRNFVVDEDRANLGSDLWKSLDKNAFILAQRDAIEAFNLARAMSLSEESAANEERNPSRPGRRSREIPCPLLERRWAAVCPFEKYPRHPSSPPRSSTSIIITTIATHLEESPSADNYPSSSKVSSPSGCSNPHHLNKKGVKPPFLLLSLHQPQYSYSTSNYSYHYQSHNQSNTPHMYIPRAHRRLRFTLNNNSKAGNTLLRLRLHLPRPRGTFKLVRFSTRKSPLLELNPLPHLLLPKRQPQSGKRKGRKKKGKERSNSNSNSSSSRKRSSSSAAHMARRFRLLRCKSTSTQAQAQTQQQNGPRDIFSPVRFNCAKCGNSISSVVLSQVRFLLPFIHHIH